MRDDQVDALLASVDADGAVALDGLRVARDGDGYAFETPDVERTGLSAAEVRAAAEEAPWYVSNWHFWTRGDGALGEHRRAFLRWIEGADERDVGERYEALADGVVREWGQLRLTATLGEHGRRRYEVRHVDDAGAEAATLEAHTDPLDAREIVTYDEKGRYRPLKTAPTLRSGWTFPDLDAEALATTVEQVYPATIANWHLERQGELDVTHWRDAVQRQTGIYGVVETWDRQEGHEHVNWVAEACCADSQCLKRREWEYDDETDLDVDGGDGVFPCREPCSLVVAAARRWTKLEGEETRTYEFDLTPGEKEQVEEIVEAVADGRIDEIREGDFSEPANRYRARFLRAKRFDEDGNLSGTPTEPDPEEPQEDAESSGGRSGTGGDGKGDGVGDGN